MSYQMYGNHNGQATFGITLWPTQQKVPCLGRSFSNTLQEGCQLENRVRKAYERGQWIISPNQESILPQGILDVITHETVDHGLVSLTGLFARRYVSKDVEK